MELTLDTLIRDVKDSSEDPLVQLESASRTAAALDDLGDALLNHFVDVCRRSGRSWAQIGEHLGVSRQAVQQRFPDFDSNASFGFERYTQRARTMLERSTEIARELRHNYVGTEHVLLALFDDAESLAAKVLGDLGIRRDATLEAVVARAPRGTQPTTDPLPFTPRARAALQSTVNVALELGHNYVGTEHILLALFDGEGVAAQVLTELGAERAAAKAAIVELLGGYLGATNAGP
jgi:hypothetical protein